MQGTAKWFNDSKGYGFIIGEGGQEYFVHWRAVEGTGHRTLHDGETVQFAIEPVKDSAKVRAANVKRMPPVM